ncbi:MFS transporter [Nocardioides sp. TRM66260-LWL]|uniref:MFS transporter n=1 Tax=Nocardioides sp. TRM66260-LWL TaxID=2874478 RepID=UPI001CC4F09B|nr:MFS transporter [Nocardioides sp. TRM66260-LWL]MBZ5733059.1 MFS transporter [Nocardioides sp. TRM66260-LWL]
MTDLTKPAPVAGGGEAAPSSHVHPALALILICSAQLMVVLDSTIANIALPFIGRDLDIQGTNLSWIVTGYALAFGGLLLLGGRLGDLYGRRRVFMIGVALFAVASALGGLAQNEAMLLGSRGLQGVGAALASPTALALITTTFPAGPQRNRAFSVFAAMSGLGAAIGLVLGGWLTDLDPSWGWRLTFLINVPIGLGAALLAPRALPDTDHHAGRLDVPGAILGTGGLLALVYGITRTGTTDGSGATYGWSDPMALTFIAAGVILLAIFVLVETRIASPIMPLRIFASRQRGVAFLAMMITPAAMFAMFFFLSQFVQNVMGYSPLRTGFAFLPFAVGMVFGATASSKLIARVDPRFLAGTGTLLAGFSLLMFSRLQAETSAAAVVAAAKGGDLGASVNYWTDIAPFIVVMALGMGLTFVPMTLVAVHGVRTEDSGIGSGVLNTMQQVGGALGLASLSTVAAHFTSEKIASVGAAVQQLGPDLAGVNPDALQGQVYFASFSEGATHAFLVGAFMIWTASLLIWALLSVKHTELAGDAPAGVHAG